MNQELYQDTKNLIAAAVELAVAELVHEFFNDEPTDDQRALVRAAVLTGTAIGFEEAGDCIEKAKLL
jgi:hypothetical protein